MFSPQQETVKAIWEGGLYKGKNEHSKKKTNKTQSACETPATSQVTQAAYSELK